jgi:AcrR family transcriptional regulator
MSRPYKLKKRAEHRDAVRQRIVDAAIKLHQTIGPNATSMADIAKKARVGRVTVYRHFADPDAVARACSGQYFARHPPPDALQWAAIADPRARLRAGLAQAHAYHRSTEAMMTRVLAEVREHPVVAPYHALWRATAEVLAAPFALKGAAAIRLRAAIGLALSFDVWRILIREQGLSDEQALSVVLRLCVAAQEDAHPTTSR